MNDIDEYKEAMEGMNLWELETKIKRLPQAEQKDLIDKLVQNYEGKYGRLFQ